MVTAEEVAGGTARRRGLVSLRAVDGHYPLVGGLELSPAVPLSEALAVKDGVPGAVAAPELLSRLSRCGWATGSGWAWPHMKFAPPSSGNRTAWSASGASGRDFWCHWTDSRPRAWSSRAASSATPTGWPFPPARIPRPWNGSSPRPFRATAGGFARPRALRPDWPAFSTG
jgi:hypothetical protein